MADKMLRVAGRGTDGTAKPIKTDNAGNLSSSLSKRNQLATWGTHTIAGNNAMKSVILRFNQLEDYSALVFALDADKSTKISVVVNWYMKETTKQVAREQILTDLTGTYFASNYLEMKGNEISVIIINRGTEEVTFNAYLTGIR